MVQLSYMTTRKIIALNIRTSVGNLMSPLFNTLSRFVKAFLPRSKLLLILLMQSLSTVILEPKKIKSVTVSSSIWCLEMQCYSNKNLLCDFSSEASLWWWGNFVNGVWKDDNTYYALAKHLVKLLLALTWKAINVLNDLWNSAEKLVNKVGGTSSFSYIQDRLICLRKKSICNQRGNIIKRCICFLFPKHYFPKGKIERAFEKCPKKNPKKRINKIHFIPKTKSNMTIMSFVKIFELIKMESFQLDELAHG